MTLLSLIGHQAKVTNCIRSRFCKYKPGCGVSHNSNHRAAELVTRAIPQLSQETEHFCRSVNKSCEDCPVWGELFLSSRTRGHPRDGLKFLRDRALELNLL